MPWQIASSFSYSISTTTILYYPIISQLQTRHLYISFKRFKAKFVEMSGKKINISILLLPCTLNYPSFLFDTAPTTPGPSQNTDYITKKMVQSYCLPWKHCVKLESLGCPIVFKNIWLGSKIKKKFFTVLTALGTNTALAKLLMLTLQRFPHYYYPVL